MYAFVYMQVFHQKVFDALTKRAASWWAPAVLSCGSAWKNAAELEDAPWKKVIAKMSGMARSVRCRNSAWSKAAKLEDPAWEKLSHRQDDWKGHNISSCLSNPRRLEIGGGAKPNHLEFGRALYDRPPYVDQNRLGRGFS